jgi:D-serine deaminase-like pyridoxal phosphate-dependent protein
MDEIVIPTMVVDEEKCRRNIRHMAAKAKDSGVIFRPHFKTHQSHAIGRWFREAGVDKIAVSCLRMAEYFAQDEWLDIMVAFTVNVREISLLNSLSSRINMSILLADTAALPFLKTGLAHKTGFYVKIDIGNRRTGFLPENIDEITELLESTAQNQFLEFRGFVAHAGQTYQTESLNDVHKIYITGVQQLSEVTQHFRQFYPDIISSWGDTPTCSMVNDFSEVDEIRPGNFVFYDLMQFQQASCDWEHIALAIAAPVVSKQKSRNEIVIYAGAVHVSKDHIELTEHGNVYGEIVNISPKGWERFPEPLYLNRISQEHGVFYCPDEYWDYFHTGGLAGIIPVHSCLAADLLKGRFYKIKSAEFIDE